ncbi:hypothetical protein [Actinopolyspora halophila]|nr:hypothetical protein [Actinopolyspora halophila]
MSEHREQRPDETVTVDPAWVYQSGVGSAVTNWHRALQDQHEGRDDDR